jgi:transcription initiation factor TFIIE subunit alpha
VAWVKQHIQETAQQRSGEAATGDGLKIAGSTPGQHKDDGIAIEMATDKDEATRRRERQEAAEAKRQQNILPSWHLKSTISGDLTALGIAESARNAEAAAVTAPSSNEDILRSLGAKSLQRSVDQSYLEVKQEDVKPVISQQQREHDCEPPSFLFVEESNTYHVQSMTSITHLLQPPPSPHQYWKRAGATLAKRKKTSNRPSNTSTR